MGVLLLQSCVSYRIKVVEHNPGVRYYFPQKRVFVSDWLDIETYYSDLTLESARKTIKEDKNPFNNNIFYIK
jgi:hypothetical protein